VNAPREPAPPLALPLVYFAAGHAALAFALVVPALEPASVAGFFFHPRMFAVVHLVTLGWITTSIFGALYIAGPMALRMTMRAGWVDWVVCVLVLSGAAGIIAHFWIEGHAGVMWSGVVLGIAFLTMAVRVWRALPAARSPLSVRAHVGLALLNLVLAAIFGALLAANRMGTILPGNHITDVFGHVHLAAVGFAVMMVFGLSYRLLPMYLPAKPPDGALPWASAIGLEIGALGLALSYLFYMPLTRVFACVIGAAVVVFFVLLARMLRRRVPAPKKLKRPDFGMLQTLQALLYLAFSTGLGLWLAFTETWNVRWITVYGVCGLLGFLAPMVLGIAMRLMPMFAWIEAWVGVEFKRLPVSPHEMPARWLQGLTLLLWTAGVPLLAYGLGWNLHPFIVWGSWTLVAAVLSASVNTALVMRHAFAQP